MERVPLDEISYERIEELADFAPIRTAIREALDSLSPRVADAVTLRIGLELPYEEVARRLNCSPAAARVRVARGLARLSDLMEVQR
jgi:RNA polymerase sigma factor (sigma-70 family)